MDVAVRARLLKDDWDTRESIDTIQLQLLQVVEFINRFHSSTTNRLAMLQAKIHSLERTIRHMEAAVRPPPAYDGSQSTIR